MFILIYLGLYLIFTLLFLIYYFIIERIRSSNFLIYLRLPTLAWQILEGLLYSFFFLALQAWFTSWYDGFVIPTFLIGAIVIVFLRNTNVAIFTLPVTLVLYFSQEQVSAETYLVLTLLFLTIMVQKITEHFFKPLSATLATFTFYVVSSSLSFLFLIIIFEAGFSWVAFQKIFLPPFILVVVYSIVYYAIQFSLSANILYESINFAFSNYYRESLQTMAIGGAIQKQKIKRAFYVIVKIEVQKTKNVVNAKIWKEVYQSVLIYLEKTLAKQAILFKASSSHYGFFLPANHFVNVSKSIIGNHRLKRLKNDGLQVLENILHQIPLNYLATNGQKVTTKISAGVSLYGVQSQAIDVLNKKALYALRTIDSKRGNRVALFNPNLYQQQVRDAHSLRGLDQTIGLDNFDINFNPIYNLSTREIALNIAKQVSTMDSGSTDSVTKYKEEIAISEAFDRYFGAIALRKMSSERKTAIALNYTPLILEGDFNSKTFLRHLLMEQVDPSQVILIFTAKDLVAIRNVSTFSKNIKALQAESVAFALQHWDSEKKLPENFTPNYIFISSLTKLKLIRKSYPKATMIYDQVKSKSELESLVKKQIFLINSDALNFDT